MYSAIKVLLFCVQIIYWYYINITKYYEKYKLYIKKVQKYLKTCKINEFSNYVPKVLNLKIVIQFWFEISGM